MENAAFGYVRVSTTKQKEKNTHENQKTAIHEYAGKHGFEIVHTFEDLAVSGVDYEREQLDHMLDRLNEVKHVIFYDWSRLSRDILFSNYLLYTFTKNGVTLHDVSKDDTVVIGDDVSILMKQIEFFVASHERKKIKERQKLGIKRFIMENGSWGRKERVLTPREIDMYKSLRKAKVSKSAIARVLKISRKSLYKNIKQLHLDDEA